MFTVPRRIVTGHTADGRSTITSDGPPERHARQALHGVTLREVWNTRETPVRIGQVGEEPHEDRVILAPPSNGTRIRICEFDPEREDMEENRAAALEDFLAISAPDAYKGGEGTHAMMHRTQTIDYGIVLEGEIVLILEEVETVVRAGDIVIQYGTNHAWANRSGKPARMAFILIDGQFVEETR